MTVDFPPSPDPNQTVSGPNGTCWTWDGEKWLGGAVGPWISSWGGTMNGELKLNYTPVGPTDAVSKSYVDNVFHERFYDAPMDGQSYGLLLNNWTPVVPITGALMRGPINMMGFRLTGIPWPERRADAASKEYVDEFAGGVHYGEMPPEEPIPGEVWTTPQANVFVWTGHLWLQISGAEPGGGGEVWSHFSREPPRDPLVGMLWTNEELEQHIWDGRSWLRISGGGPGGPGTGDGTVTHIYTGAGLSGGPITTKGTLVADWRAGVITGFGPNITRNTSTNLLELTGLAASATKDTTNAANITTGTLSISRIPTIPTTHITGLAASATTDTTNASNISHGTLALARLPTIPHSQISGLAASATTDTTNANNIIAGTLPAARLPTTTVQAGQYTLATITVDTMGRITHAASGTPTGPGGGGTVESITAGAGLDGGTITHTGTITAHWQAGLVTKISGNLEIKDNTLIASGGGDGETPTGQAGGDLDGFFPNPLVIKHNGVPFAASATKDTTNANNITTGTLALAHLPTIPTTHISGLAASATTDTTNATNITSGVLPVGRLPTIPVSQISGLPSPIGTVTEVHAGTGLSGGPITTKGTITSDWRLGIVSSLDANSMTLIDGVLASKGVTAGGIPEPSTAGNFLRTNSGTWVAGLPLTGGTISPPANASGLVVSGAMGTGNGLVYIYNNQWAPALTVANGTTTAIRASAASGSPGLQTLGQIRFDSRALSEPANGEFWYDGTFKFHQGGVTVPVGAITTMPIAFAWSGKPPNSGIINIPITVAATIPANLAGTQGYAQHAPNAAQDFLVYRLRGTISTQLGTVRLIAATGGRPNVLSGAGGDLAVGDILSVVTPASVDASLADVGITIQTVRV